MFRELLKGAAILLALNFSQVFAEEIDGEELVDPTRPFIVELDNDPDEAILELVRTVVPASYDLTFVRAGSSSPIAIINNQQVTIGDLIGGAQVIAIDRSSVTLLINARERQINLYGTSVKAPVEER